MKSADQIRLELEMAAGAAVPAEDVDKRTISMRVTREGAETKLAHLRARLDNLANQIIKLDLGEGSRMYAEACRVQADISLLEELLEHGSVVREIES